MERQEELAGEPSVDLWPAGQPAPRHPPCYNPLPLQLTWQAFSKTKKEIRESEKIVSNFKSQRD